MEAPVNAQCHMDGCKSPVDAHVAPLNDDFGLLTCWAHLAFAVLDQRRKRVRVLVYSRPKVRK